MDNQIIERIFDKLETMGNEVSSVKSDVAALRATVETKLGSHDGQLNVQFDRQHETGKAVAAIERDYVPKGQCSAAHAANEVAHEQIRSANQGEHELFRTAISDLRVSVARIVAIGGLIWMVLSLAGQVAMRAVWH